MYHLVSDFDVLEISANPMETAFAKSDKIHSKPGCKVKGGTGVIVLRFFVTSPISYNHGMHR